MNRQKTKCRRISVHALFVLIIGLFIFGCGGGGGGGGSSTQIQNTPSAVINSFASAASKGDNVTAISLLTLVAKNKLQRDFSDKGALLGFSNTLSSATEVSKTDTKITYKAYYIEDGVKYTFYVDLRKDENGDWKIDY